MHWGNMGFQWVVKKNIVFLLTMHTTLLDYIHIVKTKLFSLNIEPLKEEENPIGYIIPDQRYEIHN